MKLVRKHFDMRPEAIIEHLNLLKPIYGKAAVFGHFGRDDPSFTWERTNKVEILRKDAEFHLNSLSRRAKITPGRYS